MHYAYISDFNPSLIDRFIQVNIILWFKPELYEIIVL